MWRDKNRTMSQTDFLLRARYGEASPDIGDVQSAVLESLLCHRSIRAYRNDQLPAGTLEALIAAAQSAASSSNLQLWSVVAVEDRERKRRLSLLAGEQAHIQQAPLFLVWLADLARLERRARQLGTGTEGLDFIEMFLMAAVDASLAAQNAVVAAESLGLSTVYIGALRNHPETVAEELALPARVFPVFGLCVGYADPDSASAIKPRLPQAAVLHRETYAVEAQDPAIALYDEIMTRFYTEQKMKASRNWSQQSTFRASGPAQMSGRDRLREALNHLGFSLR